MELRMAVKYKPIILWHQKKKSINTLSHTLKVAVLKETNSGMENTVAEVERYIS